MLSQEKNFLDFNFQKERFFILLNKKFKEGKEKDLLEKAFLFACQSHKKQKRDTGEPYITHPLRVANFLMSSLGVKDSTIIAAALLHDIVEDTSVSIKEIQSQFGKEIAFLVVRLTKRKPQKETELQKAKRRTLYLKALYYQPRNVQLIKLADILDNHLSIKYLKPDHPFLKKVSRWQKELRLVLPLAEKVNKRVFSRVFKELLN